MHAHTRTHICIYKREQNKNLPIRENERKTPF